MGRHRSDAFASKSIVEMLCFRRGDGVRRSVRSEETKHRQSGSIGPKTPSPLFNCFYSAHQIDAYSSQDQVKEFNHGRERNRRPVVIRLWVRNSLRHFLDAVPDRASSSLIWKPPPHYGTQPMFPKRVKQSSPISLFLYDQTCESQAILRTASVASGRYAATQHETLA